MENQPFEDVSPVENGDFPLSMLVFFFGGGLNMQFPRVQRFVPTGVLKDVVTMVTNH